MSTADIESEDEQSHRYLRPEGECLAVRVQGPDHREHDHHQLEKGDRHHHEVDGCGVDLLVYLTSVVGVGWNGSLQ